MRMWTRVAAFGAAAALSAVSCPASNAAPDNSAGLPAHVHDYYSGYAASGPAFTSLTGRWKQPAVSCEPAYVAWARGLANLADLGSTVLTVPGLSGLGLLSVLFTPHVGSWIGLEGMAGTNRILVQVGTQASCELGVPRYVALFEVPSTRQQTPAVTWDTPPTLPGDDMRATITWDGHGTYRMTLSDLTRGWHKDSTNQVAVVPRLALAVVESVPHNVPTFGSVPFTDVTANGQPLSAYHPTAVHIDSPTVAPTPLRDTTFTVTATTDRAPLPGVSGGRRRLRR